MTSKFDLETAASRIRDEVGYINVLVANAGKTGPRLTDLKPRHTLSDFVDQAWKAPMSEYDDTYNLNCTAMFFTVLAFLKLLDEGNKSGYQGGRSQVIATVSTAGFLREPRAGFAYVTSKAAVISMIKNLSTFCVPWGIRFNAFAAGCKHIPHPRPHLRICLAALFSILTRIFHSVFPSELADSLFKPYIIDSSKALSEEGVFSRSYQPAERAGSEEDVAGLMMYMTSRAGAFVSGSVMLVDGGKLAIMPATY